MAEADTPEEDLEPFSPSMFLDLPPTPPHGDPASMPSGDLNDDSLLYQCPDDHAALLKVQQPFAQILSDSTTSTASPSSDANTDSTGQLDDPVVELQSFASAAESGNAGVVQRQSRALLPPAGDGDLQEQGGVLVSALFGGRRNYKGGDDEEADMLSLAFLKGMEEANKFLPDTTTNMGTSVSGDSRDGGQAVTVKKKNRRRNRNDDEDDSVILLTRGGGGGGRNTKLMVMQQTEEEETDDGEKEMVDKIIINDFNSCLGKMERLHIAMVGGEAEKNPVAKPAHDEAGDLHTLLVHCAQAVGSDDRRSAAQLLRQIRKHSSPTGDPNQRLAHCFAEGLEARLAGTGAQLYRSLLVSSNSNSKQLEYLKAYQLYLQACCFRMTSFTFSNRSILKAVADAAAAGRRKKTKKKKVHIVDYGIDYGWQWPALLSRFAAMEGGPPEVRITGIDLPQPGFRPSSRLDETGRRLSRGARQLGVPFKFRSIAAANWETIGADDLDIIIDDPDELLVVNSLGPFGNLIDDEGVDDVGSPSPSPRDAVLTSISNMRPDLFILCTMNASYSSSPFFVRRFRDALSYYSAMFDMLDATIPRDNEQRLLVERDLLGRCALNVIACEGLDRVERPEPYKQWQARNQRAGLRQLPLDPVIVQYLRERVRSLYHRDFFIDTDQQWLLKGWKGRILYAMSTWVAQDPTPTH